MEDHETFEFEAYADEQNYVEPDQSETRQDPAYNRNADPWEQPNGYRANEQRPTEKEPTPAGRGFGKKMVALVLSGAILCGGAAGFGGSLLANRMYGAGQPDKISNALSGQRESTVIQLSKVDTSKQMTPAEVYAANVNSTVGITTSITTNFWGFQTTSAASGSGFVLTDDGYLLTNYHVVEGSSAITVTMYDGTAYDAALVGYDESNDIAVLKIEATGLTPVTLGDSDNLNVGDAVLAIGNPLGELTFSLTSGAVSSLDREITMSNGVTMDLMQTDCAINSGNSGGALFNLYGEVIGITNAKYSSNSSSEASIDNIGFAIPINNIMSIVQSIIEKGYVSKPYVGIMVANVSNEALAYGLPKGAAIQSVTEDGPAATAGLQANDIITEINGTAIEDRKDVADAIAAAQVGDKLTMSVYRQGQTLSLTVEVGEQIQSMQEEQPDTQNGQSQQQMEGQWPWGYGFGYGR